ncbi:MAG TPA: VOC family protein [Polyangiaceae bacterium]|jgi:catechol 2,3-dioxygenase-like lactoylglutathione lyase family enzyme
MTIKLFRVILPVPNIAQAATFYGHLLDMPGKRVSSGRHYFQCGETILACYSPRDDGDAWDTPANPEHIYFAVADLEAVFLRCRTLDCKRLDAEIKTQPWGERSFYLEDPFGNQLCFVDEKTTFTG